MPVLTLLLEIGKDDRRSEKECNNGSFAANYHVIHGKWQVMTIEAGEVNQLPFFALPNQKPLKLALNIIVVHKGLY